MAMPVNALCPFTKPHQDRRNMSSSVLSELSTEVGSEFNPDELTGSNWLSGSLRRLWRRFSSDRQVSLDPVRWLVLNLVLSLLFVALAAGVQLWQTHQAAALAAESALAFVDDRLDAIDTEARALLATPALMDAGTRAECSPEQTRRLLRDSLESTWVQRFWISHPAAALACGPEGVAAAIELPQAPGPHLSLMSGRSIAQQLLAVRRLDPAGSHGSPALVATVDRRSFDLPADGPWQSACVRGARLTLRAADGYRLQVWGPAAGESGSSDIEVLRRSERHGAQVSVQIDREALLAISLQNAGPMVLMGLLTSQALTSWAWIGAMRRARLVYRLERALRKRQFEPFVQPIVDIRSGRCVGGEVLMRWMHPQRGVVGPAEFIGAAERTGLIGAMSQLVMGRASLNLMPIALNHPDLVFSFNLTPGQLRSPTLGRDLAEVFNATGLPREQVLLELTERDLVDTVSRAAMVGLAAEGWRFALDDFGTGHSSLALLEQLPLARIKIDRAFVTTIGRQTASRPVLDAIIGLARELDIRLIAEGVETQAQWDYLAERGVHSAQGFLFARPMPIPAFEAWLAQPGDAFRQAAVTSPAAQAPMPGSSVSPASSAQPAVIVKPARAADHELAALWERMRCQGGLDIRDRAYRLRTYPRCFVGREAVDWIALDQGVSRTQAVHLGRRMVAMGWIRHVADEHDFKDADLFYAPTERRASPRGSPELSSLRETLSMPRGGLRLAPHSRGLLLHRQCATGRDVVDCLVRHHHVGRETAGQWASHLMQQGVLRHVFDDRPFSDDRQLFRLA
jgi:EAL domain-containing protein (putative c-di-GMP-specific phosphodiesterase class I)